MKRILLLLLCCLILVGNNPINIEGKQRSVSFDGKSDDEAYELLLKRTGREIIEEYIALENKGYRELIPYACAMLSKHDEFNPGELVDLIVDCRTLEETEGVLVECLYCKNIDFDDLYYLQSDETVLLTQNNCFYLMNL